MPAKATPVVVGLIGRINCGLVSSSAWQTGGFGHAVAKAIVQRPPLAPVPTVIRPTASLPPIDGELPQSPEPEERVGVAPENRMCWNIANCAAVWLSTESRRKLVPSNVRCTSA